MEVSSVGVLGVFKVIRDSFLKEKFTLIFGASVFFALIAAMYGGLPIVYFIDNLGWNTTFAIRQLALKKRQKDTF